MLNQLVEIDVLEDFTITQALEAELANLFNHSGGIRSTGLDILQPFLQQSLIGPLRRILQEQFSKSHDWRQGIVKVVRNATGHLA